MSRTSCDSCGSVYELKSTKLSFRDKDTLDCDVCGAELYRWNEAKMWEATLIERHENHLEEN